MLRRTTGLLAAALLIIAGCGQPDGDQTSVQPLQPTRVMPLAATRIVGGFADGERSPTPTSLPKPAGACSGGCVDPPSGCVVKGTVGANGLKIYLLPRQPGYDSAQIAPAQGERWFCTANEALEAGWSPLKQRLPAGASG